MDQFIYSTNSSAEAPKLVNETVLSFEGNKRFQQNFQALNILWDALDDLHPKPVQKAAGIAEQVQYFASQPRADFPSDPLITANTQPDIEVLINEATKRIQEEGQNV